VTAVRPSAITIVGQRFEVRWLRETLVTSEPRITESVKAGRASVAYQWIAVDTEQGADQVRDTLLHEVIHIVFGLLDRDADDALVRPLATVLLEALRANPQLVEFLLEREDMA
jgi:predicted Zn-dependent protease with MMP-like domain